jgi:hypothetical protein
MVKFQYHCDLKGGKSPLPVKNVAYFKNRNTFEVLLNKWSRRGWSYFETKEDRQVNDKQPKVVKYDNGSSLDTIFNCSNPNKTYAYWYDTSSHSVSYIKNIRVRELV